MEKTAKKMFEELGWELKAIRYGIVSDCDFLVGGEVITGDFIEYRKEVGTFSLAIFFLISNKKIYMSEFDHAFLNETNDNRESAIKLSFETFQAVNKQAEELGWGKEEE